MRNWSMKKLGTPIGAGPVGAIVNPGFAGVGAALPGCDGTGLESANDPPPFAVVCGTATDEPSRLPLPLESTTPPIASGAVVGVVVVIVIGSPGVVSVVPVRGPVVPVVPVVPVAGSAVVGCGGGGTVAGAAALGASRTSTTG